MVLIQPFNNPVNERMKKITKINDIKNYILATKKFLPPMSTKSTEVCKITKKKFTEHKPPKHTFPLLIHRMSSDLYINILSLNLFTTRFIFKF